MEIYTVGGYVRDKYMGLAPKDRDYVVVGSNPAQMEELGFKQVGADFPVFLHPVTGEEYALARTERKVAGGYHGFTVETTDVTLEEDLFRRDLTMNAMAMTEDGRIIDPYCGLVDIDAMCIRHVSKHFAEDPVRILRVARFAARYGFYVADETMALMTEMVNNGEFDNLTKERVTVEFLKAAEGKNIRTFIKVLKDCGAWYRLYLPSNGELHSDEYCNCDDAPLQNFANIAILFHSADTSELLLPTNVMKYLVLFNKYFPGGYSGLASMDAKLSFIDDTKAVHSSECAICLLRIIYALLGTPPTQLSADVQDLIDDVATLKKLDMLAIVSNAKASGIDIAPAVHKQRLFALASNYA